MGPHGNSKESLYKLFGVDVIHGYIVCVEVWIILL